MLTEVIEDCESPFNLKESLLQVLFVRNYYSKYRVIAGFDRDEYLTNGFRLGIDVLKVLRGHVLPVLQFADALHSVDDPDTPVWKHFSHVSKTEPAILIDRFIRKSRVAKVPLED